jgi:hypothetical protein
MPLRRKIMDEQLEQELQDQYRLSKKVLAGLAALFLLLVFAHQVGAATISIS